MRNPCDEPLAWELATVSLALAIAVALLALCAALADPRPAPGAPGPSAAAGCDAARPYCLPMAAALSRRCASARAS